jgi:hypothetical protein
MTCVPPPVLDDSDLQFVQSVARTFSAPEWDPEELESVLSDSVRLIRSIAVKYTDKKKVELNFSDLESEGRVKLIKRLQGTPRSPSILVKFAGKRGDFFRHLKAVINNHIKGIVYRNVCTAKRTGRKIPAKDSMPVDYDRSWHPDVSLNNPDISKSVELMASDPGGARSCLRSREFESDMGEILSQTEFLVYRQMTNPNPHAVSLAMVDSYRGRKINSRIDIKITQDHLAVGLGMDRKMFSEVTEKIRTKIQAYMHTEESGHTNAAIATLETVFGVQIPRAMPAGVVRRLLTLVARDNHQKVTPEVESMLKSVGAKPPSFNQNGDMTCFGVLFQKNNRHCSVCGLRQSCEVEAANYDLGQVALSPKLFAEKALVRTVAATDELPLPTVSAAVPDSNDMVEPAPAIEAIATPTSTGAEPMSVKEEELKSYLEGNFKPAIYRDELYYQHKVRDGNKLKSIFWLGRINGRLELRFCKASPKLAKHLFAGKRKTHYAPADVSFEQLKKLINQHSDETFRSDD